MSESDDARFLSRLRNTLAARGELGDAQIAELETHVVDAADDLDAPALTREEKLLVSAHRLGVASDLEDEFRKVTPIATWKTPVFWATCGVAWTLGVEAILELAVPLGSMARSSLGLSIGALVAWVFFVYVGGPLIAFGSVGSWMRARSAGHPSSRRALLVTVLVGFVLRIASVPLMATVSRSAWRGIDTPAWRSVQSAWQAAGLLGLVIVGAAGVGVFVWLRRSAHRPTSA